MAVPRSLERAGFEAWLVGGCVRDLLRGAPVRDLDVASDAGPEAVLALFPRAVPIGLRHGTVMVPTAAGPVDVTRYRAGGCIEEDLAHRDFTVNAMAWSPASGRLLDPFDGRADLAARRLRAVGDARARFREDALRALRAARLAAQLGFAVDPAVEEAMAGARAALAGVARERIRAELSALLLGERAEAGVALLRRTGLEADLVPGAPPDAGAVIARLPADRELRLAAWLRGCPAEAVLARLRFPRATSRAVERLVRVHPLDAGPGAPGGAALRRLIKRAGEANVERLLRLREAEIEAGDPAAAPAARTRLAALREELGRLRAQGALALRRRDLALSGREVMQTLGCGPGPEVGRALDHLTECVIEDPACNTPEALRERLVRWAGTR